ncbi:ATP-binding protein [bacterium]|nr:ATP-binding protein [bacterium]MBU1613892.1 ATP-binding protein [bacterium]
MFVNREKELRMLEKRYAKGASEFLIIYGRRRVGKTELIRHFVKSKPHIYFLADKRSEKEQLELFSLLCQEHFTDPLLTLQPFNSWDVAFTYLSQKIESLKETMVLVFDEFPYLAQINPALPSILQRYWDTSFNEKKIFFILCGSSMSFMEKEVLSYKSPLYGRRTGQLLVKPFNFLQTKEFFPGKNLIELVEIASVFGSLPQYLRCVSPEMDIFDNIRENILAPDKLLFREVPFILMEELRSPQNYFAILKAISFGKTKTNGIVQITGLDRGMVGKYLDVLISLGLIERKVPVTQKNPAKSRKGIYLLNDNFFRFWFRFVYPHLSYLEEGRQDYVMDIIRRDFDTYVGQTFEPIAREYLIHSMPELSFERIGAFWDGQQEIDIIGINDEKKEILFGECKWTNKPVDRDVFFALLQKKERVLWYKKERKEYFCICSKNGFTEQMKVLAKDKGVLLIDFSEGLGAIKVKS